MFLLKSQCDYSIKIRKALKKITRAGSYAADRSGRFSAAPLLHSAGSRGAGLFAPLRVLAALRGVRFAHKPYGHLK